MVGENFGPFACPLVSTFLHNTYLKAPPGQAWEERPVWPLFQGHAPSARVLIRVMEGEGEIRAALSGKGRGNPLFGYPLH
jgi:hypothetical protein